MNYIILNGVKSTTIKGLLIQSLPPVSKPQMRTDIEEIDGRDGDIVTKLGYSAYDKPLQVGLYGKFNVDEVISFFDSEGTVTFSNEPDKFYYYQVIEQIDFERLIRFKTAEVVLHVQPFKYALVGRSMTVSNEFVDIPDWTQTKNGITLTAKDGRISVIGTGTAATEFYVPISNASLEAGSYTLSARAEGTKASACSIRLIGSVPSNADSFGGNYLALQNNATATMTAALTAAKTFGYLWFYITAGTAMDFDLDVSLVGDSINSLTVFNRGNTVAKPSLTLYGSGVVNLSLNGQQIFIIDLDSGSITIDAAEMNAYQGERLMNRYVSGDYNDLALKVGSNLIDWTGDVYKVEIDDYSRWI